MNNAACCLLCSLSLVLNCCRQQNTGTVIARAGDSQLTLEEAKAHIDTSGSSFNWQLRNYVAHWINTELLYQEAKRKGIENSENFLQQLDEAKRQLASQKYLDEKIYNDTSGIDAQAMQEYFRTHASEFYVKDNVIKLNIAAFSSRERASAFAAMVSRGTSWHDAVDALLHDTTLLAGIVTNTTGSYYTQRTLYPSELWKVASALGENDVSFPVKTENQYWVLQPLVILQQGKPADFELARDEVRQRLLIEQRRQHYDELLGTLRKRYNVEIFLRTATDLDSVRSAKNE